MTKTTVAETIPNEEAENLGNSTKGIRRLPSSLKTKAAAVTVDPYPNRRKSYYGLLFPSVDSHIPLKGGRRATATRDGLRGTRIGTFAPPSIIFSLSASKGKRR